MEVHHPHHPTHKKKWSEYILEFFMLFTAVTLGFFAENLREGIAEKHKKEELLIAVAEDFKKDFNQIEFLITTHSEGGITSLDFLLASFIEETYNELFS